MQRVSTMSVIVRASGVSEAYYNGQRDRVVEAVRQEAAERIRAARAEADFEHRRADDQARAANRLRKQRMDQFLTDLYRRPGFFRRIRDRIEAAWATAYFCAASVVKWAWVYFWVYTFGGAWIDVLIWLKLIERIED